MKRARAVVVTKGTRGRGRSMGLEGSTTRMGATMKGNGRTIR